VTGAGAWGCRNKAAGTKRGLEGARGKDGKIVMSTLRGRANGLGWRGVVAVELSQRQILNTRGPNDGSKNKEPGREDRGNINRRYQ